MGWGKTTLFDSEYLRLVADEDATSEEAVEQTLAFMRLRYGDDGTTNQMKCERYKKESEIVHILHDDRVNTQKRKHQYQAYIDFCESGGYDFRELTKKIGTTQKKLAGELLMFARSIQEAHEDGVYRPLKKEKRPLNQIHKVVYTGTMVSYFRSAWKRLFLGTWSKYYSSYRELFFAIGEKYDSFLNTVADNKK